MIKMSNTKRKTTTKKQQNLKEKNQKQSIKKKEEKQQLIPVNSKFEKIFCIIIALIFLILFILSFSIKELIPATLITLSLELFAICYFIKENNGKLKTVYTLFAIGVLILLISVFYTISHVI